MAAHPWLVAAEQPVDRASLVLFRVALGALLAIEAGRYFWNGWIVAHLTGPVFHFTWPGFGWVAPLPGAGLYVVLGAMAVMAVALGAGVWRRPAAAALAVGWTYLLLIDRALYLNHHVLVVLLCLLLVAVPGLDRRGTGVPAWVLWAFRAVLVVVYLWAGISKLDGDWYAGMPLWITLRGVGLDARWLALAGTWWVLLLELLSPVLLSWRRTRTFAVASLVVFHVATVPLYDIGIFPFLSLALLSLWLDPGWPRRRPVEPRAAPARGSAVLVAALLMAHALVPARSLLVEGDPDWHGHGSRLAWRLLTSHKTGWVWFELREPASGATTQVSPLQLLTPWQAAKMARDPEMIRQFAVWLAEEQARAGLPPIEVRAVSAVSLNGRPPVPIVHRVVDLVAVRQGQDPFSWIAPLIEPLPAVPVSLDEGWWLDGMRGPTP